MAQQTIPPISHSSGLAGRASAKERGGCPSRLNGCLDPEVIGRLHRPNVQNGAKKLMAATVQNLDDDQVVDVSAHFSALVKGALDARIASAGDPDINHLVEYGISSRGIPACASCHGAHAGGPIETPTLSGQRQEYLAAQLSAFATAERRNDVFNRMRAIAGKLRKDEIDKLAEYYAAQRLFRPRD